MSTHICRSHQWICVPIFLLLVAGGQVALAQPYTATWTQPMGGIWTDARNWSTSSYPDGEYHVYIDSYPSSSPTVSLNAMVSIIDLTIDSGDSLDIGGRLDLTGNSLANSGTITLDSHSQYADLRLGTNSLAITGGGTIVMSGPLARVYQENIPSASSPHTLTNVDNEIRGSGYIGVDGTALINQGTIRATNSDPLIIDPRDYDSYHPGDPIGVTNTGTIQADSGGELWLADGLFTNTGGVLQALAGSTVWLLDAEISGGVVSSSGDGYIDTSQYGLGTGLLRDVTIHGDVRSAQGGTLGLAGAITCDGRITVAGADSELEIYEDVTLSGGGEILLQFGADITEGFYGGLLTNTDHLIHGAGNIEAGLVNHHIVQADDPADELVLDGCENYGTLQALIGSTLSVGNVANLGSALIRVEDGAGLVVTGEIQGGQILAEGTGSVAVNGTQAGYRDLVHETVTVVAASSHFDDARLTLGGAIENRGTIEVSENGAYSSKIMIDGSVILTGGGVIELSQHERVKIDEDYGGGLLTNVDNTIRGAGTIGAELDNRHVIEAIYTTPLVFHFTSTLVNSGLIVARPDGRLHFDHTDVDNTDGQILAEGGGSGRIELENSDITGGELQVGSGAELWVSESSTLEDCQTENLSGGTIRVSDYLHVESELTNHAGATISITPGGTVSLDSHKATLDSQGLITIQGGEDGYGKLALHGMTLSGGGEVRLNSGSKQAIIQGDFGSTFTNLDHLIHGEGTICNNDGGMINYGTIRADDGLLTINPGIGSVVVNQDLMEADGGELLLEGDYDNTGGTIHAADGSTVMLDGVDLSGGLLSRAGTGSFELESSSVLGDGLRNEVHLHVDVGRHLNLRNVVENAGTIELTPTSATFARLEIGGPQATLTGGGTVLMGNKPYGWIGLGGGQLTNEDNVISGAGALCLDQMELINHGEVRADDETLVVDPSIEGVTNTGRMTATIGATMLLTDGHIYNTGGTIEAEDYGRVELENVHIIGGELASTGTGRVEALAGTSTLVDVTNRGLVVVPSGLELTVTGSLANEGTISVESDPFETNLWIAGEVTLSGGGLIELSDSTNNRIVGKTIEARLINEGNTIRGSGQIGAASLAEFVNRGVVESTGANWLKIDLTGGDGMTNEGIMRAIGERGIEFADGMFTNVASVEIQPGSKVECAGAYEQTAGLTDIDGGLLQAGPGRRVDVLGGEVRGEGDIIAMLRVQTGGTLSPGRGAPDFVGLFDVIGDVSLGGHFGVDLAGTAGGEFDAINVDGVATVGGVIDIAMVDGFVPGIGDSFDVVVADGVIFDASLLSYNPLPNGWFEAGVVERPDGSWACRLTVVPEPATLLFATLSLCVVLCSRPRRPKPIESRSVGT